MILPLRRYAQFYGRSGRREFWFYSLFLVVGYTAILAIDVAVALFRPEMDFLIGSVLFAGWGIFFLINFVPGLALTTRRLHDLNLSGTWTAAAVAAVLFFNALGWLAYMVVMSLPPKSGPNRHGPPVGEDEIAAIFS
jgi:uncharacterized membrane protein YhaH (DUF805 family)